jgi:hypothetical protein
MSNPSETPDPIFAVKQVIDFLREMVDSESYFTLLAQAKAKYYNSLINAGFEKDEALKLTAKFMGGL